jgi:hypothetical protein
MRRISLLALCLSLILPITGFCKPHDVWLVIKDNGHSLVFEDGHLIRFEGCGKVEFDADRRFATIEGHVRVYVNGERVTGERPVHYGERVELRGDGANWTIQSVIGDFPGGMGTRISDEKPDSKASVESSDGLVFFLQANSLGGGDFFYPDASS